MIVDTSEQQTLTALTICNTCKSYKCAFLINKIKEFGKEPLVKRCDGYK